jgi:phosphoribosylanthranilate isomerase
MLIKICGMTRPEDAEAAVGAGADLVGFIFVPGTPRALEEARSGWVREVEGAEKVGVFLDSPLEKVMRVRDALGLDWIQLHGDEPDSFLDVLGEKVIRRVKVGPEVNWDRAAHLAERCLPLFDPGAGDGASWAWETLAERPAGIRFGLSGWRPDPRQRRGGHPGRASGDGGCLLRGRKRARHQGSREDPRLCCECSNV